LALTIICKCQKIHRVIVDRYVNQKNFKCRIVNNPVNVDDMPDRMWKKYHLSLLASLLHNMSQVCTGSDTKEQKRAAQINIFPPPPCPFPCSQKRNGQGA
jgi:hypothetical protein